ncbi:7257_t:CDS:2, partial [Dentiscutata erythropus]
EIPPSDMIKIHAQYVLAFFQTINDSNNLAIDQNVVPIETIDVLSDLPCDLKIIISIVCKDLNKPPKTV